jgi:hypothetical protein
MSSGFARGLFIDLDTALTQVNLARLAIALCMSHGWIHRQKWGLT